MEDNVLEVEAIPEKGITVTTAVVAGQIETSIQQDGVDTVADTIQKPLVAGHPLMQHDLAVHDVHSGKYGDFSEEASPTDVP